MEAPGELIVIVTMGSIRYPGLLWQWIRVPAQVRILCTPIEHPDVQCLGVLFAERAPHVRFVERSPGLGSAWARAEEICEELKPKRILWMEDDVWLDGWLPEHPARGRYPRLNVLTWKLCNDDRFTHFSPVILSREDVRIVQGLPIDFSSIHCDEAIAAGLRLPDIESEMVGYHVTNRFRGSHFAYGLEFADEGGNKWWK